LSDGDLTFTGERLHAGNPLFGVDLARHRAAYVFAIERAPEGRVLDLGCGSGYGAAELAEALPSVVGLDRVPPDRGARGRVSYVRADLEAVPLLPASFDLISSFQVIEHLVDPTLYLNAMTRLLAPGGTALITTPNLLTSDKENPFHVHEYDPDELRSCLQQHFSSVEMYGVGTSPRAAKYFEERLARIATIVKIDPLRLRHKLPRWLVDWIFAKLALVVRRGIQKSGALPEEITLEDFPIGPMQPDCIDLLAICRDPIAKD
jgi:SAM-dependent methyltransferase